jgi:hypothetical protein
MNFESRNPATGELLGVQLRGARTLNTLGVRFLHIERIIQHRSGNHNRTQLPHASKPLQKGYLASACSHT